jgi:hypothetical protein
MALEIDHISWSFFSWGVESDAASLVLPAETTHYSFHQDAWCRKVQQLQIQRSLKCHTTSYK